MLSASPPRRLAACAAALVLLVAVLVAVPGLSASAVDCPPGTTPGTSNGFEICVKDTTPTTPDPDEDDDTGGPSGPRVCTVPAQGDGLPEFTVDCVTDAGIWNDARQCYEKLVDPQPSKDDPIWDGHDEGYIVNCTPSEAWCNEIAIPNGTGPAACLTQTDGWQQNLPGAEPVDPEELAREAFASLAIDPIDIGIVPEDDPGRVGLVGMPAWMWAQAPARQQMGPLSASATDQGLTVTLDARVDRVVWDMGDGSTVTCTGPGTPYQDSYGKKESPDCGYMYTRQGEYQVSATTYWVADWTGGGQAGQLTDDFASPATTITVGELQVLTQ